MYYVMKIDRKHVSKVNDMM